MPLPSPRNKKSTTHRAVDFAVMDQNGKLSSWKGQTSDAEDLKMFVESGRLEGLTPKQIMEKYPQFNKYAYGTFNSALSNARKAFNNMVGLRGSGLDRKFSYCAC